MLKVLFFDDYDLELTRGFERRMVRPRKHSAPLYRANAPWETGYIGLFGSVLRRPDGLYQLWYWTRFKQEINGRKGGFAYAESDDGLKWRRRELDLFRWRGRPMNICFPCKAHGGTIIYDSDESHEERRYKMIVGAEPGDLVYVFCSPDGTTWTKATEEPVIARSPSGPMALLRQADGTFVTYLRAADRRCITRSESSDFLHWSAPRTVIEPDGGTPAQDEFFAMTAIQYGAFEIGLPWICRTRADNLAWNKQEFLLTQELAYTRSGYAWHRVAPGDEFIARGRRGAWDSGIIMCASSPTFEEDEIRFYYSGTKVTYQADWKRLSTNMGLSMAVSKPDRFVGLEAGTRGGVMMSRPFAMRSPEVFVNASIARGGSVVVEMLDMEGHPLKGFRSLPITGDGVALPVQWAGKADAETLIMRPLRFRLRATRATLYSVWMRDGDPSPVYHRFRAIGHADPMRAVGVAPAKK